ncbi:unnamed protein product [Durusdinium trenchii]|uniref:Uncharacterized protein n=2 Tax=Durusdinium trenchii TaxID=1381693 RepID=A0ABP0PBJ2_9DINO
MSLNSRWQTVCCQILCRRRCHHHTKSSHCRARRKATPFVTSASYDELTFVWYKEAQSQEYLKKWVLERKMTQRVEDLQPFGYATLAILWFV